MLGEVHPWTIGVFVTSIAFAIAALVSAVAAIRWARRPDRPPWWRRFVPTVIAFATFGLAVWLAANGIIGLRTWAW